MLWLRTGLPGASKTLNTLREICHDKNASGRDIYYNNIKLLMLDFDVVSSFQGYFYGYYLPQVDKKERPKYQKILLRIHGQGELVSEKDFPHLRSQFNAWVESGGHIQLWLSWVRQTHPKSKLERLEDYLKVADSPTVDDLKQFKLHWNDFPDPTSWPDLPPNSIIVVDECQRWFPVRPVGSKVPRHVSEFETHRHKGLDIHLVTQDAKLLDSHVRRLVGRHIHFSNPLASKKITRMEHDKVFNPSDYHEKKNATKAVKTRDKKFYGLYWSADAHTHKVRIPKILLMIPVVGVVVTVALFMMLSRHSSDATDKPVVVDQSVNDVKSFSRFPDPANPDASNNEPEIKHFDQIIKDDTPLSSFCDRVTYAGKEVISRSGSVTTNYYLQCEKEGSGSEQQAQTDDEEKEPKSRNELLSSNSYLLDYRFLKTLGYELDVVQGMPILRYDQTLYAFPRL